MPRIRAEIARTPYEHSSGLMGRKYLSKDSGMFFDFGKTKPLSFWMANTYLPLQIAFIDENGKIGQIENMVPMTTRAIRSREPYRYALEVNQGWFDDHGIQVGAQVAFPMPDMADTTGLPGSGDTGGMPGMPAESPVSPEVQITQSFKDILRSVDDYGIKIIIEYQTKDGITLPPKAIEPPFVFDTTADGDVDGLVTAWDAQRGRYSSFIIDNILSIKDLNGNPLTNSEQAKQQFDEAPLTQEEADLAEGIMQSPEESLINEPDDTAPSMV